jgi:imidazolonepropionase-like amidohydrolase
MGEIHEKTFRRAIKAGVKIAGAELLGWSDRLGTVEAGKLADIVAAPGDPLEDITRLEKVQFVMKEGFVYPAADAAT